MKIPDNVSDNERSRLKALSVNEERRLAGLPGFQVDIYKDGVYVDSQAVYAETQGKAETMAMMLTTVSFKGELATYRVRSLG